MNALVWLIGTLMLANVVLFAFCMNYALSASERLWRSITPPPAPEPLTAEQVLCPRPPPSTTA